MTFSFTPCLFSFLGVKRYGLWPGKILVRVYEATYAAAFCSQNILQFCFEAAGTQDGAVHTSVISCGSVVALLPVFSSFFLPR